MCGFFFFFGSERLSGLGARQNDLWFEFLKKIVVIHTVESRINLLTVFAPSCIFWLSFNHPSLAVLLSSSLQRWQCRSVCISVGWSRLKWLNNFWMDSQEIWETHSCHLQQSSCQDFNFLSMWAVLGTRCPWCGYLTVAAWLRKLATASCHLYEGNALRGQKGNFLHKHLLCVVMKGKCVSLCAHLRIGFLLEKRKRKNAIHKNACHSSFTLTVTHSHIGTHIHVISPVCDGMGRGGSTWGQLGWTFQCCHRVEIQRRRGWAG